MHETTREIIEDAEEHDWLAEPWWLDWYHKEDLARALRDLWNERQRRVAAAQFSDDTGEWLRVSEPTDREATDE